MKVLIADDSEVQLQHADTMVAAWGFTTIPVGGGSQAIAAFHRNRDVRLAIIDWEMPILDGLKVIEHIKSCGHLVHIIMMSARTSAEDLERAFTIGADDYIRKPFHPVELRGRLMAGKRMVETQVQLAHAQKLESIGQLAAGIAHEINTPAQYVSDNLEFLEQSFSELRELLKNYQALQGAAEAGDVPPGLVSEVCEAAAAADVEFLTREIPLALTQSRDGMRRVSEIVHAMKEFSHPGSTEKTPLDLNHAIESTVTVARNEWKYVANLEMDFDTSLPLVPCLAAEINNVVLNIVVNAAHALAAVQSEGGEEKGEIRIRTRREGDGWVVIEISDTGPGMPEAVRRRVFDPFFTTKEVGKGSGQGLAIARSAVVDKHQGTIEVESTIGQGTTFSIRLPLAGKQDATQEVDE